MADAIGYALTQAGIQPLIHYLDDFFFFIPPKATYLGSLVLSQILSALGQMGVPVAVEKIEGCRFIFMHNH